MMSGLVYDIGRYLYEVKESLTNNVSGRHNVTSEVYIVEDNEGFTRVDSPNLIWDNPEIYRWVSYMMIDNTMVYFFEFTG